MPSQGSISSVPLLFLILLVTTVASAQSAVQGRIERSSKVKRESVFGEIRMPGGVPFDRTKVEVILIDAAGAGKRVRIDADEQGRFLTDYENGRSFTIIVYHDRVQDDPFAFFFAQTEKLTANGKVGPITIALHGIEELPDSDEVLLSTAEDNIRKSRLRFAFAYQANHQLNELLRLYPDSPLRNQAEERLQTVNEMLGTHDLSIALFYLKHFEDGKTRGLKGAEGRLRHIVCEYPRFSQMNEVLLQLVKVYSVEEDGEEELQYLEQFIYKQPSVQDFKEACEELRQM